VSEEPNSPDFDSIKQISPYGAEFWSARDLGPLLGYKRWENFEIAIKRAKTSCQQVGQIVDDHFREATKPIKGGKGSVQNVKDYILSRFSCYLIAQNGDPRKIEIAVAQTYFATAARQYEIQQLREEQDKRLRLRERVSENNKDLSQAAYNAGVLSKNFGVFQDAGYRGLYGGLGAEDIKHHKNISPKEDILDRMGSSELAANDFRITQARDKLREERIIGQTKAIETHQQVGKEVRGAIKRIGGRMPEDLPTEPSIKPLMEEQKRKRKKVPPKTLPEMSLFPEETEDNPE